MLTTTIVWVMFLSIAHFEPPVLGVFETVELCDEVRLELLEDKGINTVCEPRNYFYRSKQDA